MSRHARVAQSLALPFQESFFVIGRTLAPGSGVCPCSIVQTMPTAPFPIRAQRRSLNQPSFTTANLALLRMSRHARVAQSLALPFQESFFVIGRTLAPGSGVCPC